MMRFVNAKITKYRELAGMNETELAARLTLAKGRMITAQAVRLWETGEKNPNALSVCHIAHALGVGVGDLFEETGDE